MLNAKEINECIDRAAMSLMSVSGPDKISEMLKNLGKDELLAGFIQTIALEVSYASTVKGVELADKEMSILTMPEGFPVLVRDKTKNILAIVVPEKGKFYLVGTRVEMDIKPDCWYDAKLFDVSKEEQEDGSETKEETAGAGGAANDGTIKTNL